MTVRKTTTIKLADAAPAAALESIPHQTVTACGRDILVKVPTVEQLMAWEKIISAISEMHLGAADYEMLRTQTDRFYQITTGVFVNDADKEWIEAGRMDGTVSIADPEIIGLMGAVAKAFEAHLPGAGANRKAKRAAARKRA